jgi:site-specific DNA recombinase
MPTTNTRKNCVIYCRVSSSKQAQQGESLEEQEKICVAVAERLGYNIIKIYKEQFSGRKEERPKIDEAFEYIKQHPKKIDAFIFRVIDRFTRGGFGGYDQLKQRLLDNAVQPIDSYGVIQPPQNTMAHLGLQYSWSNTNPSEITEIFLAQKGKQEITDILTRMIGAEVNLVREGYHIGRANEGYVNDKIFVEGKKKPIQKPDFKYAPFFIKMFELRATGIYTDAEIVDHINAMGYLSTLRHKWSGNKVIGSTGGKILSIKHLQEIIENPIYCGVKVGKWVITPIKTKYKGLVSISTFNKANKNKIFIEEKKDGSIEIYKDYTPHSLKRTKDNPLFPFKLVILCPICKKPFLGSTPKGKSGKGFPTYHCCRNHKYFGINKEEFEKNLAHLFKSLKHKEEFFKTLEVTLINKYREKEKELGEFSLKSGNNVAELEIEKLQKIDAFTNTNNETIRTELEKQIVSLQERIVQAQEQRNKNEIEENDIHSFIKYSKYLMEHTEEMLMKQENFTVLQALFGVVFDELPTYTEILNGTPKLSLVYKLSEKFRDGKSLTAGDGGIEPPPKVLETFVLPLN